MNMDSQRRGEGFEEGANQGAATIRRLVKRVSDYSAYLDLSSIAYQPEEFCRAFSASASDWIDYDALGNDFIQISLDSIRGTTQYRFNCKRAINCRKLVEENTNKKVGYLDSVDTVREFLDDN